MRYILVHDDALPENLQDCNVPVTPGDTMEQVLQKVKDTILYVDHSISNPGK